MENLAVFFSGLWIHWWALMSCAAFTILSWYIAAAKKGRVWTIWVTFGIAVSFLFVASYLTWQDTHKELTALKDSLKAPELNGRLGYVGSGPYGPSGRDVVLTIIGEIMNPHGPQSAAYDFKATLHFQSPERTVEGEVIPTGKEDVHLLTYAPGRSPILGNNLLHSHRVLN
jgi:hypothetical protein